MAWSRGTLPTRAEKTAFQYIPTSDQNDALDGANPALSSGNPIAGESYTGFGGGKVVQQVRASISSVVNCNTVIAEDDSIPENTEGVEVLTVAITPASMSNILVIQFTGTGSGGNPLTDAAVTALFRDSVANALAATIASTDSNTQSTVLCLTHYLTAPSTSSQTYKIRVGRVGSGGGIYVNGGSGGTRLFGGVAATTLIVTEYEP